MRGFGYANGREPGGVAAEAVGEFAGEGDGKAAQSEVTEACPCQNASGAGPGVEPARLPSSVFQGGEVVGSGVSDPVPMTDQECLELPAVGIGQVLVLNEDCAGLADIEIQGEQYVKVMALGVDVEEVDPVDVVALEDGGEFLNFHLKGADIGGDLRCQVTKDVFTTESGELIIPDGEVAQLGLGFVRDIEEFSGSRIPHGDRFDDETTGVGIDLVKLVDAVGDRLDEKSLPVLVGQKDVPAGVAGDAIVCTHLDEDGRLDPLGEVGQMFPQTVLIEHKPSMHPVNAETPDRWVP